MTTVALETLPASLQELVRAHAAALASDPTKDHRYRATQLGSFVVDYLSWKANDQGATEATLDSYERVLARLSVQLDKPPAAVTTIDLRTIRDSFTVGQRRKATAVIRDYFRWLYDEHVIEKNPADRLRAPKRRERLIEQEDLYTDLEKAAIVTAQTDVMDRVGVLLLFRAGLRQNELQNLRVRDVNLVDKYVIVRREHGKGSKQRRVPIKGETIRALEELMLTDIQGLHRPRRSHEFLLCPLKGGGRSLERNPEKPYNDTGMHRWWYRCLERAGIVDKGVTSGRRMHDARHSYATDLGRATNWNLMAVSKNLGHASIKTTADIYMHFAFDDQADAVGMLPEIGDED